MKTPKLLGINATIILSFFLGTLLIPVQLISHFIIIWRFAWLGWMLLAGERFNFNFRQWTLLGVLLLGGFFFANYISPELGWPHLAVSIILAPLTEELFFRSWLIKKVEGSDKQKILITSLFFGIFHIKNIILLGSSQQLFQIFYTTLFVGPLFAWVRLRTGSIFYTVALHAINNTIAETLTRRVLAFRLGGK